MKEREPWLSGISCTTGGRTGSYICGGSSAASDRKTQLKAGSDVSGGIDTLKQFASQLFPQGQADTKTGLSDVKGGLSDTEKASKYYSDILSGDPTKVMAAVAPETKAVGAQVDQAVKSTDTTGNRSGGSNAGLQDTKFKAAGAVGDIIAKARGGAAAGVERTGAQKSGVGLGEAGIGLSETGLGVNAEQAATGDALSLYGEAAQSRQISQKIHDAAVKQWADLIAGIIMGIPTGGAGAAGAAGAGGDGV